MTEALPAKPSVKEELQRLSDQLRVSSRRLVGLQKVTFEISQRLSELSNELQDPTER